MKFRTLSGSMYEVDRANMQVRRLKGETLDTCVANGEWRKYDHITIMVNNPGLIVWASAIETAPNALLPGTVTSLITQIEEDAQA